MNTLSIDKKFENLKRLLSEYGRIAIAFSGGVDSTFLAHVAYETLGNDNTIALTAVTKLVPESEIDESKTIAVDIGINHHLVKMDLLTSKKINSNPPDRCYVCKKTIFTHLIDEAKKSGFNLLADGSNFDDTGDYRPGMKAIKELGVKSPLIEAGLTKQDIRDLSKELSIKGSDRPASPCLATRIPYNTGITEPLLKKIELAEKFLKSLGYNQVRVRAHGDIARIEVDANLFDKILRERERIISELQNIGFKYISLDLNGFKSGSMNRSILESNNDD